MKIFLIRHGQTDLNEKSIFRGRMDVPLNDFGKKQASAVANRLLKLNIRKIYTSPLKRTVETAKIIADKLNIVAELEKDLIDFDFGKWEGLSKETVKELYPDLYMLWLKEPHKVKIPKAENLDLVRTRISNMLNRILANTEGNIAIVSHRVVLKILICFALSLENSYFWRIKQDTGAISILTYENEKFSLDLLNDSCHLQNIRNNIETPDF